MYDEGFRKSLLISELGLMTFEEVKKNSVTWYMGQKVTF